MTDKTEMLALADEIERFIGIEARAGIGALCARNAEKIVSAFRTAAASAEPVAWRPIETAPKDRFIIVYCPEDSSRWMVKWQGGEWYGMDCQHGIRRTGQSIGGPDYVTGWFVSHWREIPEFSK